MKGKKPRVASGRLADDRREPLRDVGADVESPVDKGKIIALFGAGAVFWLLLPAGPSGAHSKLPVWRWAAAFGIALLALIPPVRKWLEGMFARIRQPAPRTRMLV